VSWTPSRWVEILSGVRSLVEQSFLFLGVFFVGYLLGYWIRSMKKEEAPTGIYFSDRALRGDRSLKDLNKKP